MEPSEEEFSKQLIEAVKKRSCLFDYEAAGYSNKHEADKAWESVADEIGSSSAKCRDKWRNIRSVFARSLRPRPGGIKQRRPYYLGEKLHFLTPFLKSSAIEFSENWTATAKRETKESGDESVPSPDDGDNEAIKIAADPLAEPRQTNPRPANFMRKKIKMSRLKINRKRELSGVGRSSCEQNSSQANYTSRRHFLLSLLEDVEGMSDQQFRVFRRGVVSLIDDVLELQLTPSEHESD